MTGLAAHLASHYGVPVTRTARLDTNVYRVDRRDGSRWVARVFPPERALSDVEGDATVLEALREAGFPAERCADPAPVSALDGRGVLVTGFVEGAEVGWEGRTFAVLGALLGRLHARPGESARPGGAWHHLSYRGGPPEEIAAAVALLAGAEGRVRAGEGAMYDALRYEVDRLDDGADLPKCFVHPDFVPANAIGTRDGRLVMVDWTGAGRGTRLWSLALPLWAAGNRRLVDAFVSRYRLHVTPEPEELDRLAGAIRARPLLFAAWAFATGHQTLPDIVAERHRAARLADAIASRVREAFGAPTSRRR